MKKIPLILAVSLLTGCQDPAFAYTDKDAIRCIVGEASGEGYHGMVMVGETIHRRGNLHGCYGINAAHIKGENRHTWIVAEQAWHESEFTQYTHGATGWGSKEDWRLRSWRKGKIVTARWLNHIFYVNKRKVKDE